MTLMQPSASIAVLNSMTANQVFRSFARKALCASVFFTHISLPKLNLFYASFRN
jgi:hypothetical protein